MMDIIDQVELMLLEVSPLRPIAFVALKSWPGWQQFEKVKSADANKTSLLPLSGIRCYQCETDAEVYAVATSLIGDGCDVFIAKDGVVAEIRNVR